MVGCKKYTYGEYTVNISRGNQKMGEIHSISLPRLITCPADVPCKKDCYMRRLSTRPSVKNTYDENYQTWKELPEWYWFSIIADCKARQYFRWHVCGDIPSEQYLFGMIRVAKETPNCTHLCFTKQYQIVNNVLDDILKNEGLPNNLILVFSRWGVYPCDNKYNLPEAWVALDTIPEYAIKNGRVCTHSCEECNMQNNGCFQMKHGDVVILTSGQKKEQDVLKEQFEKRGRT